MRATHTFFATTAKGMEAVLANELSGLGATKVEEKRLGVAVAGKLEVGYRACLWSRVASRVLLPLATFSAHDPESLYDGVRSIDWRHHVGPGKTIAVDCSTVRSLITHSHYGALKTKDAIVDQLRERSGRRPSVDVARPSVRVNVRLHENRATVSIDLSGESLHRRSYRQRGVAAPLKETLAATVLLLADWPRLAPTGAPLVDPMCGSGTLLIEAALIAADIAPGWARTYFGFLGWGGHDPALWTRLRREAEARGVRDPKGAPQLRGYDVDAGAVRTALGNVERAGVGGAVHVERRALADCEPVVGGTSQRAGLRDTNPPYGERLGDRTALAPLYATLGDILRRRFMGWTGCVLTGNLDLGRRIGLRTARRHILYNGPIESRLLVFPISADPVREANRPRWRRDTERQDSAAADGDIQKLKTARPSPSRRKEARRPR